MNGNSLDIREDRLEKLKQVFPELFTENQLDWEKLQATFTDHINFSNERYVLNWAGKANAFKSLQQPTAATLNPVPEESVNFDTTENIFIEGENLEVLKVLQKSYYGKIKCIIIDPPYNTGSDSFIYPDDFKEQKAGYQKTVGDKDENGFLLKDRLFKNTKENGHFHSNWLSMMYPRLSLARNLLNDDGVIFVHIDDNETHNLRLLMNEIYGEENFIAQIIWERAFAPVNLKKHFSESHDYILCFAKRIEMLESNGLTRKSEDERYTNPDNDSRGDWTSSDMTVGPVISDKVYEITTPGGKKLLPTNGRCWLFTKRRYEEMVADKRIWFGKFGNNVPRIKKFLSEVKEGITPMTIWKYTDVGHSQDAAQKLKALFHGKDYFDYPKSVALIKRMLLLYCNNEDIVLDFFAGSGTTAEAVLELNQEEKKNCKFILVQLPEPVAEKSEAYNAGYKTIADITKERVRKAIKKLHLQNVVVKNKENSELKFGAHLSSENREPIGFKVFKLAPSNFKTWRSSDITADNLVQQLDAFTNPIKENYRAENMLYEILLKAGYTLTEKITSVNNYYSIDNGKLIIALTAMDTATVGEIIASRPEKVITLDLLFSGNDALKTNTTLQMQAANIDFKTI